jgi:hypothetical protein
MQKDILSFFLTTIIIIITSCQKADIVPVKKIAIGSTQTVAQLKALATCTNACAKKFSNDIYLYGIVIADETSGNFYEELYLRDYTGAMHLALKQSNNLLIGDSIRVNLKGLDVWINANTATLEIDSIDQEKQIVKLASGYFPKPKLLNSINDVTDNYYGDLIQLSGVEFISSDVEKTYADAINGVDRNLMIRECNGAEIIVRSSAFSKFASQKPPSGNGSIIAIASSYNSTKQLYIRNTNELNMNATRCITYLQENFNSGSTIANGWTQVTILGAANWNISSFSGSTNKTNYVRISGYISGSNTNCENWLISPAINLNGATNPALSFYTAAKFPGNTLDVLVSSNYISGNPSTATWTSLAPNFVLSPNNYTSNYVWTYSGMIPLNTYKTANTRIAFKYTSITTGAAQYQIDDIIIKEN